MKAFVTIIVEEPGDQWKAWFKDAPEVAFGVEWPTAAVRRSFRFPPEGRGNCDSACIPRVKTLASFPFNVKVQKIGNFKVQTQMDLPRMQTSLRRSIDFGPNAMPEVLRTKPSKNK